VSISASMGRLLPPAGMRRRAPRTEDSNLQQRHEGRALETRGKSSSCDITRTPFSAAGTPMSIVYNQRLIEQTTSEPSWGSHRQFRRPRLRAFVGRTPKHAHHAGINQRTFTGAWAGSKWAPVVRCGCDHPRMM
jgi:hypothetical protein